MLGHIYHIQFREPPLKGDCCCDFYFTSIAAIYDVFTPEQVGTSLNQLWASKIDFDRPYYGKLCFVKKEPIRSKPQKRTSRTTKNSD